MGRGRNLNTRESEPTGTTVQRHTREQTQPWLQASCGEGTPPWVLHKLLGRKHMTPLPMDVWSLGHVGCGHLILPENASRVSRSLWALSWNGNPLRASCRWPTGWRPQVAGSSRKHLVLMWPPSQAEGMGTHVSESLAWRPPHPGRGGHWPRGQQASLLGWSPCVEGMWLFWPVCPQLPVQHTRARWRRGEGEVLAAQPTHRLGEGVGGLW